MKKCMFAIGVMGLLAACSNTSKEAATYNDHIIDYQGDIIQAFNQLDTLLKDSLAEKQQIDYAYVQLQATVKHGLLVIDSIGPFQRDPIYQKATRDLFSAYDEIVTEEYDRFIDIITLPDTLYGIAQQDSAILLREKIRSDFDNATNKFILAQEMFGKKYNIEFEPNP